MSPLIAGILSLEILFLIGFGLFVRSYIKNLFREDLRRDWQWARLVYVLRDQLREARGNDDPLLR